MHHNIELVPASGAGDFVVRATTQLYGSPEGCWLAQLTDTKEIDSLFSRAQADLAAGMTIEQTALGVFLDALIRQRVEIAMWYADEWQQLPTVCDFNEALRRIESALTEGSGEIYLMVTPPQNE
jgi:hypothetical protein